MNSEKTKLSSLRNIEWRTLKTETNKINQILPYISTNNITGLNELIYAGAKLVCEKIGIPSISTKVQSKPGWETLNRISQLPELTASAVEHKTDIICIQEHRYMHNEDIKNHVTGNGRTLATVSAWKYSVNATVGGVGILIGPRALKSLYSIERIQPRMIVATFNGNPRATIISCYSPTNVSEETELFTFYDELSSLVHSIQKHKVIVIGGELNAKIGKKGNN